MKGWFLAAGAFALLLATGCGDNSGSPTGYQPDGLGDTSVLLLDVQPANADSSEIFVYGEIYDATSANGYRLYVDPSGQGFRPAADFVAAPTHTFSTGVNDYRIRSLTFDLAIDNVFLGRGSRNGIESTAAPLTEKATVYMSDFPQELARRLDVPLVAPLDSAITDSVPTLSWAAVPGAVRYRVHIEGRNGVTYLVLTDATTHKVESADPGIRLEVMPMRAGLLYRWGVDAIDAQNKIIGTTRSTRALLVS